jgi:hypothetical protein
VADEAAARGSLQGTRQHHLNLLIFSPESTKTRRSSEPNLSRISFAHTRLNKGKKKAVARKGPERKGNYRGVRLRAALR